MDHVWIFTTDVPEDKLQLLTLKSTDVDDTWSNLTSPSMRQLLKMLLIFLNDKCINLIYNCITNYIINNNNLSEKVQLKMLTFN